MALEDDLPQERERERERERDIFVATGVGATKFVHKGSLEQLSTNFSIGCSSYKNNFPYYKNRLAFSNQHRLLLSPFLVPKNSH